MRKIITFITFILLGFLAFSQNTSPLVVKDFVLKTNGIMDIEQVPRDARTDWDNNPVCMIQVKAVGFDENLMQKFVFVPNGLDIMHKTIRDGMVILYVSSNKTGEIVIKHMGDCTFKLPYKLEGHKIYVLTLGMETATLVIRTIPTNAEIYIDNQKVGTGEAISAVSIGGEHRYRVVCEDYYTKEGVVVFSKREEKSINVELEPNYGFITIKTEPSGAEVYVDNTKVGTTPYMMKKITLGNHVVELRKTGYEIFADMVTVKKGEVNKQFENVTLTAMRVAYGTLFVTSTPEGADINVDGDYMGRTPQTFNIVTGEHQIILNKQGCTQASKTVFVNENQTTSVNLYLETGREISITTNGSGDKIYIDGAYVGMSPLTTTVGYGTHNVEAVREDINKSNKTIMVDKYGGDTSVYLELSENIAINVNGVSLEMIYVQGGTFNMGDENSKKQVRVDDYYIGKFEVTQALWKAVVGTTVNEIFDKELAGITVQLKEGDNLPMNYVTWNDCQEFINKLNKMTGKNFRLPTEAEWEYAARGGNKSKGCKYSGSNIMDDVSWNFNNSKSSNDGFPETHVIGTKMHNELGIYDMSGNVSEWCQDNYEDLTYKGNYWGRVRRGGNYYSSKLDLTDREQGRADECSGCYGFRVVLSKNNPYATKGMMEIATNPFGATITINGKNFGLTPVTLDDVPGQYTIVLSKRGYENVTQTIELKAGLSETTVVPMTRMKTADNVIKGVFSINKNTKVLFAKGNLQYQASTKTYRFAEQPWEVVGKGNEQKSPTYKGWIDLFGWGTGNNPTNTSLKENNYAVFDDWGDNNISNGEGKSWFTLTNDEWVYVLNIRKTNSGIRFVMATVNNVKGVVLFPDDWNASNYKLNNTNKEASNCSENKISLSDWTNKFDPNGAIFMPLETGCLEGTAFDGSPYYLGLYWSDTYDNNQAFGVGFSGKVWDSAKQELVPGDNISAWSSEKRSVGRSVRLVRLAE